MAIYRIVTPPVPFVGGLDGEQVRRVAFASSEGGAKAIRRAFAEAHGLKLQEVEYAPIDLRPGKSGFIDYMNAFHAMAPASYEPEGYPKVGVKKVKKPAKK